MGFGGGVGGGGRGVGGGGGGCGAYGGGGGRGGGGGGRTGGGRVDYFRGSLRVCAEWDSAPGAGGTYASLEASPCRFPLLTTSVTFRWPSTWGGGRWRSACARSTGRPRRWGRWRGGRRRCGRRWTSA